MDYERLLAKRTKYEQNRPKISHAALASCEKDFMSKFIHNSTAIEGNTLTLSETKTILEDGISIGGKELREIYEIINNKKAYDYIRKCIFENKSLTKGIIKDLHTILTDNIITDGTVYDQYSYSSFIPSYGNDMYLQIIDFYEMYMQINSFYDNMKHMYNLNPIELASWTYVEFLKIHPFIIDNGCTSRLLMNYQLMLYGFLPVSISKEDSSNYYGVLEEYALNGNLEPFADFVAQLEEIQLDERIKLAEAD